MNIKTWLFFIALFALVNCKQPDKKLPQPTDVTDSFIKPPVNGINISYSDYTVDAAKGDTIFYKTGSIILLPPNSFVDSNGNIIQGNVQVKYREFSDPIDFYLAGITMNYDSAGKPYVLESAAMCEITAFKDGIPVFVNPESKPEINLASDKNAQINNLYYLDTVQKKWINQGVSDVFPLSMPETEKQPIAATTTELREPLKPVRANNKTPVVKIAIDPLSFQELSVYNNLQFQVDESEKNFNPRDSSEEWSNVELVKKDKRGLYTIKFSNTKRTVSFLARPVLEGKDYDEALVIFNQKQNEYNRLKEERIASEKKSNGSYIVDSLKYLKKTTRNEKLNRLIDARNREIEKQNELIAGINKSVKNYFTFTIDRFGYWNCDYAVLQKLLPITATFKDARGEISLTNIAVLVKDFNSIFRYPNNNIAVLPNTDNMIIGTVEGKFAYISYEDYQKLGINENTKQQIFFMTVISGKENNYDSIKAIAARQ